jgi:hypothetical protein
LDERVRKSRAIAIAALGLAAAVGAAGAAGLPLAPRSSAGKLVPAPSPGRPGPEGVPIPTGRDLAAVRPVRLGETVDGVTCQSAEKVAFHIHTHLTVFVRGKAYQVPYGIGIGPPLGGVNTPAGPFVTSGTCFMWLHTHAADGIIHIEAPKKQTFTLGQFFAVWGQPLSASRVGPYKGKVTAFYDGKVWTADPAKIPLSSALQVQLDVGSPVVAPEHISFPQGLVPSKGHGK